ncbi:MAG: cytochrome c maturation protein CcmE [Bacteroidetes bacterium]|nr:MAG: cytochrome c maturation protein CcmE [Bacteroidota bacterium]
MKTTHLILLGIVAIFAVAIGVSFSSTASIYTDFASAKASGKQVHIVGSWVNRDEANYDPQQDLFTFYLQDTLQHVARVLYYDPKPTNFESAEKIVVIGGYKGDDFVADKIVMKCPSKYEETDITAGEHGLQ